MNNYEVLVSYSTPDGYHEEHWVTVESANEEDAKKDAINELVEYIRMYAEAVEVEEMADNELPPALFVRRTR